MILKRLQILTMEISNPLSCRPSIFLIVSMLSFASLTACTTLEQRASVEVLDFPAGGKVSSNVPITPPTQQVVKPNPNPNPNPPRIKIEKPSSEPLSSTIPIYGWPKVQRLSDNPENRALIEQDLGKATVESPTTSSSSPPTPTPTPTLSEPIVTPTASLPVANDAPSDVLSTKDSFAFSWPTNGALITSFGQGGIKGIELAGKVGDPVFSAADGSVTYTGVGLRGYGKLVVIKHANNFLSVYAHNSAILVKEGERITRGQKIAELGDTEANRPKLLFQLRQGKNTLDPKKYLPPRK